MGSDSLHCKSTLSGADSHSSEIEHGGPLQSHSVFTDASKLIQRALLNTKATGKLNAFESVCMELLVVPSSLFGGRFQVALESLTVCWRFL